MYPSKGPWRSAYQFHESRQYNSDRPDYNYREQEHNHSHEEPSETGSAYERKVYPRGYNRGKPQQGYSHRQDGQYAHGSSVEPPRRRGSPVYEDYGGPQASAPSSSQPSRNRTPDSYHERGYSNYRRSDVNDSSSTRRSSSPAAEFQERRGQHGFSRRSPAPSSPRRSSTPPPARRTEPSEEYLATSLQPSTHISDPTSSRKMIVLDLNGSLLVRSPHKKANPYADHSQPRGLRSVHPRPYLAAFVSYILHPETKKWLDTMVWSSAQPHSVDDMVQTCFKQRRNELKAVWARDTLGLSGDEYHKKTQTTKDLEKPWAVLSALPPSHRAQSPSSRPTSPSRTQTQLHSAKSTLLVDDSPLKAILQPWNHLCIKEYVQDMRRKDLEVAEWEWLRRNRILEKLKEDKRRREDAATSSSASSPEAGEGSSVAAPEANNDVGDEDVAGEAGEKPEGEEQPYLNSAERRKLKRQAKKLEGKKAKEDAKLAATSAPTDHALDAEKPPSTSDEVIGTPEQPPGEYDPTLLAVIGILDHLKHEDNVAGWMRAGGLLSVPGVSPTSSAAAATSTDGGAAAGATSEAGHTVSAADGRTPPAMEEQGREKRRRVSLEEQVSTTITATSSDSGMGEQTDVPATDVKMEPEVKATIESPNTPPSSTSASTTTPQQELELEQATTGVPTSDSSPPSTSRKAEDKAASPSDAQPSPAPLWFDHPEVFRFWAQRGREALGRLGIEGTSGIERVPGGLQPPPGSR
ncbi:hypothetical protein CVT26_008443 [Gymnopilus dilepis]|uniref:FCP1 homology domain-containing protein n=1 Tax=Gymnopilus dilepis TaxID=231916 RepID=A0A409XXG3_9AGAR|nr:hypothetical protein CVT26_008443 [Gymnopilus dilepis]